MGREGKGRRFERLWRDVRRALVRALGALGEVREGEEVRVCVSVEVVQKEGVGTLKRPAPPAGGEGAPLARRGGGGAGGT